MHATILKGIVGGFEFSVFQRNLKELARKAVEMCLRVLKEINKSRFDSYSRQEQCIDHIPYYLSWLPRAHFSDNLSRNSCISLGFRNVMTSSSRRKLGRHCFYCFCRRFGDRQILLEITFDCKSTYSSLRSSESQSRSRFLFFLFRPQNGSHGLVETGDKNRNVTDNITFSRAQWMFCE